MCSRMMTDVSTAELFGRLFQSDYRRRERAGSIECCRSVSSRYGYMYYGAALCITVAAVVTMHNALLFEASLVRRFCAGGIVYSGISFSVSCCVFINQLVSSMKHLLTDRFPLRVGRVSLEKSSTLRSSCHVVFHRRGQPACTGFML